MSILENKLDVPVTEPPTNTSIIDGVAFVNSRQPRLDVEQLWIAFGKGKDFRWIPIHDIAKTLGLKERALPFFHAFTGCDTVLPLLGKSKSHVGKPGMSFLMQRRCSVD